MKRHIKGYTPQEQCLQNFMGCQVPLEFLIKYQTECEVYMHLLKEFVVLDL